MSAKRSRKTKATKKIEREVWAGDGWKVLAGRLVRRRGRPRKEGEPLFEVVGEKLPFQSLASVKAHVASLSEGKGVYVAHDSMGYARYVGRGDIFARLKARHKAHERELMYFSFYVVKDKKHEREIETLLIRAGGPHLHFNERKKRVDIKPGDMRDFEAGTSFCERQRPRGRRKA